MPKDKYRVKGNPTFAEKEIPLIREGKIYSLISKTSSKPKQMRGTVTVKSKGMYYQYREVPIPKLGERVIKKTTEIGERVNKMV